MTITNETIYTHYIKVGENILQLPFNKEYSEDALIFYITSNIHACQVDMTDNRTILFYRKPIDDYRGGMNYWFEFKDVDSDIDMNSSKTEARKEFLRLYKLQKEMEEQ